jgi:hypothetical protein
VGKIGRTTDQQIRRLIWLSCLCVTVVAVVAVFAVVYRPGAHTGDADAARAPHPAAAAPASRARLAWPPAATWPVASPLSDLSVPLPGMPPVTDPANIYAGAGPDMLSPAVGGVPYRIYVPNSGGSTVAVINPASYRVIGTYQTGLNPQHVVPTYDMRTLYVTNDLGNSLTPISPRTARPAGPNIPVDDPYNMYFTPDGRYAVVVAEARQHLDFRNPHTFALEHRITVDCVGVDHIDFAANGAYLIATCEFAGRLVRVDLHTLKVAGYLNLPGSEPSGTLTADVQVTTTGQSSDQLDAAIAAGGAPVAVYHQQVDVGEFPDLASCGGEIPPPDVINRWLHYGPLPVPGDSGGASPPTAATLTVEPAVPLPTHGNLAITLYFAQAGPVILRLPVEPA